MGRDKQFSFWESCSLYATENTIFSYIENHLILGHFTHGLSLLYSLLHANFGCYNCSMNKRSVKTKRPAKAASRSFRNAAPRKGAGRAAAAKAIVSRLSARKSQPISALRPPSARKITASEVSTVTVAQITPLGHSLRTHKFHVGQTVFYTSSPISRPGASGSYKVVRLLPSYGEDYQYRIKNPGEAFERVAKESQLEVEH